MLAKIRKFVPAPLISAYHKALSQAAAAYYGRPAEKLLVIGVTGTNGKSTTVMLSAKILTEAGLKVGAASTAMFKIGEKEWLNDTKMTMLGRFGLQRMLAKMAKEGCEAAVIETSSQGIEQFRHLGINYDVCVFTNLTPEHIEAHGGFDNYKNAKLELFKHLQASKIKTIRGKKIPKTIIANGDDQYAAEFLDFAVSRKIVFGLDSLASKYGEVEAIRAENPQYQPNGVEFSVTGTQFNLRLYGRFNIYNSLAAMAIAQSQDIGLDVCRRALERVEILPGRMEFIENGLGIKILVDYAPEPESMRQLLETIRSHQLVGEGGKIIHVFGSCGGGRDVARRPILGELSAKATDILVITNEDPYDDDPNKIIDQVIGGAVMAGKVFGKQVFKITDRREAIAFALKQARPGDLVLLTGKGSEQAICVADGQKIPWDERQTVRELLGGS